MAELPQQSASRHALKSASEGRYDDRRVRRPRLEVLADQDEAVDGRRRQRRARRAARGEAVDIASAALAADAALVALLGVSGRCARAGVVLERAQPAGRVPVAARRGRRAPRRCGTLTFPRIVDHDA
jgi:hypothetical protein